MGKKCNGRRCSKCNVRSQTQCTVSDFLVKLQAEEESPSTSGSRTSNRSSESHQRGKAPGGWGVASRAGQTGIRVLPLHAAQRWIPELKRNPDIAAKEKPSMPSKTEIRAQVHSEGNTSGETQIPNPSFISLHLFILFNSKNTAGGWRGYFSVHQWVTD